MTNTTPDAEGHPNLAAATRLPRALGRRQVIVGAGAALVVAGCGSSGDAATGDDSTASTEAGPDTTDANANADAVDQPASLIAFFSQQGGFVSSGIEQRIAVGVLDGENGVLENPPSELTFRVIRDTEKSDADGQAVYEVVTEPITVPFRKEGLPRPYYSMVFTAPEPGIYQVGAEHNGRQLTQSFIVSPPEEVPFPQVGDQISGIATPTVADGLNVDPICTQIPPCPFHEVSLDEALEGDRPIVLMVSTPRFCNTAVCGPVLDLLIDDIDGRGDNPPVVIHTEVWDSIEEDKETTDMINSLTLTYEPALFALDPDGTIVGRLDNIFDATEIAETIDAIA